MQDEGRGQVSTPEPDLDSNVRPAISYSTFPKPGEYAKDGNDHGQGIQQNLKRQLGGAQLQQVEFVLD